MKSLGLLSNILSGTSPDSWGNNEGSPCSVVCPFAGFDVLGSSASRVLVKKIFRNGCVLRLRLEGM